MVLLDLSGNSVWRDQHRIRGKLCDLVIFSQSYKKVVKDTMVDFTRGQKHAILNVNATIVAVLILMRVSFSMTYLFVHIRSLLLVCVRACSIARGKLIQV